MAGSMALINLAKDAAQGNIHNLGDAFGSLGKGALQGLAGAAGGVVGGVVGGKLASYAAGKLGGLATSLGGRMLTGALEGAGEDLVDQLITTGTVDLGSLGMSAALGGLTGGKGPTAGHTGDLRRASHATTPNPRKQLTGDSGTQSPGTASSGGSSSGASPSKSDKGAGGSNDCDGCSCHSFAPDTRVVMADGTTKPIKDIQLGDQVKATDPESGANAPKTVTVLHNNQDTDLTDVTVTNSDGSTGILATTQHHPFWDATTQQWVLAKDLVPGHQLHTPNGDTVTITKVANRDLPATTGGTDMRDLTIADIHTYYVIAGEKPVLVHNCLSSATNFDLSVAAFRPIHPRNGRPFSYNHNLTEAGRALQKHTDPNKRSASHVATYEPYLNGANRLTRPAEVNRGGQSLVSELLESSTAVRTHSPASAHYGGSVLEIMDSATGAGARWSMRGGQVQFEGFL